jgi:hypothetical protein
MLLDGLVAQGPPDIAILLSSMLLGVIAAFRASPANCNPKLAETGSNFVDALPPRLMEGRIREAQAKATAAIERSKRLDLPIPRRRKLKPRSADAEILFLRGPVG